VRKTVPRAAHAAWHPSADRRDPVDVLQEQSATRLPDLVPVRYGRMLASPFAFFRGAAAVMAMDLATLPTTQLHVQLCGDAHLVNFGVFGSPERELLFDINDFDETLPGPFEWDLKRLLTSFELAGRANHFDARHCRECVLAAAAAYRESIQRFARMSTLAVWYTHVTIDDVTRVLDSGSARRDAAAWIQKARSSTSLKALNSLTRVVDGHREIVNDPPLVVRLAPDEQHIFERVHRHVHEYRASLTPERRHLFDRFRVIDMARKVVGIGSVGTRCYIVLLEGPTIDEPLFLQVKEADQSVLEPYLGKSHYQQHGQRVVVGQHWMQAASDIFLGWQQGEDGYDFYIRQLEDLKGSVPVESVDPTHLLLYGRLCGSTLARAHARSGDGVEIAAYVGQNTRFDEALADFASAYADQTEHDHQALVEAHASGRIKATPGT
jgi:uncharacterized protein (DUF2252 family)